MEVCNAGSESAFRFAGMWLQFMGVGMTALGFRDTRLFFGQPGMRQKFWQW
jgi:hypothetical protein